MATLESLQAYLEDLTVARRQVLQENATSVTINGRTLVRPNPDWLTQEIELTDYRIENYGKGLFSNSYPVIIDPYK